MCLLRKCCRYRKHRKKNPTQDEIKPEVWQQKLESARADLKTSINPKLTQENLNRLPNSVAQSRQIKARGNRHVTSGPKRQPPKRKEERQSTWSEETMEGIRQVYTPWDSQLNPSKRSASQQHDKQNSKSHQHASPPARGRQQRGSSATASVKSRPPSNDPSQRAENKVNHSPDVAPTIRSSQRSRSRTVASGRRFKSCLSPVAEDRDNPRPVRVIEALRLSTNSSVGISPSNPSKVSAPKGLA